MKSLDRTAHASRPEYDVHLTENVMVPMRDGVRMATDIYRPARDGRPLTDRRPVLLHRTPYNKVETEATSGQCRFFASRGYVVVNQDCRGCFGSRACMRSIVPGHLCEVVRNMERMAHPGSANHGHIGLIVRVPYPPVSQLRLQHPDRIR